MVKLQFSSLNRGIRHFQWVPHGNGTTITQNAILFQPAKFYAIPTLFPK